MKTHVGNLSLLLLVGSAICTRHQELVNRFAKLAEEEKTVLVRPRPNGRGKTTRVAQKKI